MVMFNNTVRKPFIVADTNALTHRGGGILSVCRVADVQGAPCMFSTAV